MACFFFSCKTTNLSSSSINRAGPGGGGPGGGGGGHGPGGSPWSNGRPNPPPFDPGHHPGPHPGHGPGPGHVPGHGHWPGNPWDRFPPGSHSPGCNPPSSNNDNYWVDDEETSSSSGSTCSTVPVINIKNDLYELLSDGAIYLVLVDNTNAKALYEGMTGSGVVKETIEGVNDGDMLKTVSFIGDPGAQEFFFRCWRTKGKHYCELLISETTGGGRKSLKSHYAKNDAAYFIVRNDTDYSSSAQPLFEAFPDAVKTAVKAGTDAQIGYPICGGQEFVLPEQGSVQLKCRSDSTQYFCKFVVNTKAG